MKDLTQKKRSGKEQNHKPTTLPFFPDISVSLSGVGDLLTTRFKVEDKMKRPGPIYILDERTGKICKITVAPKIGPLMSSRKKCGNMAFCIFQNTNFVVRPGSLVTFVIGDYKKEHIEVVI